MSRWSGFLALSCLLAFIFPQGGAAQRVIYRDSRDYEGFPGIIRMRGEHNMQMLQSYFALQEQVQFLQQMKALQEGAQQAAQGQKAPPPQPPYVQARHQYKHSPNSTAVEQFIQTLNVEEAKAAELKAALTLGMQALMAEAKKLGRQENLSFSVAVLLGSSHLILHGEELGAARFQALAQMLDQFFGRNPKLDNAKDADKQKLSEGCQLSALMLLAAYQHAVATQDAKAIEEAKLGAKQLLKSLGIDEKDFKLLLEKLAS
ncbi:MAG: hypothetical protein FWG75_05110 [Cystobacterineae bacterium]|nr:hypothetical protein [Cystobacterineae bacterium]